MADESGSAGSGEGLSAVLHRIESSMEVSVEAAMQTMLRLLGQEGFSFDALRSLVEVSDSRIWNALLHAAAHPSSSGAAATEQAAGMRIQSVAGTAFVARGDGATDSVRRGVLLDGLRSDDAAVRGLAAELLGLRGEADALAPLAALLNDRDDHVRAAAVRALASLPAEQSLPHLLRALQRFDVVAAEAVTALARIGAPAVAPLVGELQSGSDWTRWHAAKALGGIGDPAAADALVVCLNDDASNVRWEAAFALAQIGERALDPLLHGLVTQRVTPWFAEGALRVLRRIGTGELHAIVRPVEEALHHQTAAVEAPVAAARARQALRELATG